MDINFMRQPASQGRFYLSMYQWHFGASEARRVVNESCSDLSILADDLIIRIAAKYEIENV